MDDSKDVSQTSFSKKIGDQPQARACADCQTSPPLDFDITFAFQPIADLRDRSVFGYEALVRGTMGEPAAEILSKVNDENRYRFDQTCRVRALTLAAKLGNTKRTSINFLPNAIYRPELCLQTTLRAANALGIPMQKIVFEIVEAEHTAGDGRLAEIVREYRRLGVSTAIDDFGAGYAGLNLLAEFQPDFVKIDMGLVRNVDSSPTRRAIVHAIVDMCRALSIGVMAEGVETSDELRWLLEAGVSMFQGYFIAPPSFEALPEIDFDRCLARPGAKALRVVR